MKKKNWIAKFTPVVLFTLLVVIVIMMLAPKKVKTPREVQNIEDLETFFEELVQTENPSSLNFVVVKNGDVVYDKAFGQADAPNDIPATTETVYHWWSTTKVFTAVAIMQLNEQGLLNLDDAVIDYLPFFEVQYPSDNSTPVTIRHLLNHSSGLPDNVPAVVGWMHYEGQPTKDQTALLQEVLPDYAKLDFEPGEKSAYTNVGYMVLGAVVEEVSGERYEDYVRNYILEPLQMQQTDFVYTETMQSNAAVGMHPLLDIQSAFLPFFYGGRMDGLVREVSDGKIWFYRVLADSTPPTGLIGPAGDMARFEASYLNGGILDGVRILSEQSVLYMSTQNWISATSQQMDQRIQGTGWEICGEQELCLAHGGGGPGYGSAIRLLPDQQIGFVLLTNSTNIDREGILDLAMSIDW